MKKNKNEAVHLCPNCNCIEMEFLENVVSAVYFRVRRFKCPVCDLIEMYTMGGPNDSERVYRQRQSIKHNKILAELNNEYKQYKYN